MVADPERSPGFLLWHVTLRWQRAVAAALTPLGLTHVQFVLLASTWWLNEHGGNPNQLTLARHAGTDVKMTSQVLGKLEAKELIRREVDPADTGPSGCGCCRPAPSSPGRRSRSSSGPTRSSSRPCPTTPPC